MNNDTLQPFRLAPYFSERIWGRWDLRPWYDMHPTTQPIGEAWLTGPQCIVETGPYVGKSLEAVIGDFPLLIKILFPNDKLSVQVHPDDAIAQASGHPRGKTECWYVLEAEPGATVALGVKKDVDVAQMRASVDTATMENLLEQVPVFVGDMLYVDAGTVHAINGGMVLLETQQTSDLTYRLYDYGRPRELHLEQGFHAMKLETRAGKVSPRPMEGFVRLIEERYFIVDRFDRKGGSVSFEVDKPCCLVGLKGTGKVGEVTFRPGQAIVLPEGLKQVTIDAEGILSFVRCTAPTV